MVIRVADMSVEELKTLIQETVTQTLTELLSDPDEGLELREDFKSALQLSLETVQAGEKTIAAEDVAAKLGLSW
jgi:hypothetical protein